MNTPAAGEAAEIAVVGSGASAPVTAGGSITAGDKVSVDGNGKVQTRSSTNAWIGTALQSGASGEVIQVLLNGSDGAGS